MWHKVCKNASKTSGAKTWVEKKTPKTELNCSLTLSPVYFRVQVGNTVGGRVRQSEHGRDAQNVLAQIVVKRPIFVVVGDQQHLCPWPCSLDVSGNETYKHPHRTDNGVTCAGLPTVWLPQYLADTLCLSTNVAVCCRLRSSDSQMLQLPSTWRTTLCDHAFSVAAVRAWNSLPPEIRNSDSLLTFRRMTKRHSKVVTNPSTNRARRNLTLLIWQTPFRQVSFCTLLYCLPRNKEVSSIDYTRQLVLHFVCSVARVASSWIFCL